jgi:hypothetical protein
MSRRLRSYGLFRDLPFGEPGEPSVSDQVASTPAADERRIADYLRSGLQYATVPALTFDVLSPDRRALGPLRYLTDGEWIWRSDLAHYVEHYHCRVAAAFVEHMQSRNWLPPAAADVNLGELTYWPPQEDASG